MQTHQGIILQFDPNKGYGFIHTKGRKDIFFHIKKYRPNTAPVIGMEVVFNIAKDEFGRDFAYNIQELEFVNQKTAQAHRKIKKHHAYREHREYTEPKNETFGKLCLIMFIIIVVLFAITNGF